MGNLPLMSTYYNGNVLFRVFENNVLRKIYGAKKGQLGHREMKGITQRGAA